MKRLTKLYLLIAGLFSCLSSAAQSLQIDEAVWLGKPISFVMPVDEFVTIYLPEGDWGPGIGPPLQSVLQHYAYQNTLQLKTTMAFQEQLLPIRNVDTQEQIILKIKASKSARVADLNIIYPPEKKAVLKGKPVDITKQLTRHAALTLYAPLRLVPENPRIRSIDVEDWKFQAFTREGSGACILSGLVEGQPVAAWSSGHYYVTAVRLQNLSEAPVTLDTRGCHVTGDFLTSALQHTELLPTYRSYPCDDPERCERTLKDVTTLYLTSKAPFWASVSPAIDSSAIKEPDDAEE